MFGYLIIVLRRNTVEAFPVMGVTKEILREGDGTNFPIKGETLTMHYKGTLASDGSQFDSSYDKGRPFQFKIGRGEVIQGWDDGGT